MKPIKQDELFGHLSEFLKNRGVELKQGSYANSIQKSCGLLTDAINLSQEGMLRAKSEVDKKLDQMRQVIHEKTAPRPPRSATAGRTKAAGAKAAASKSSAKAKAQKPKAGKAKA